MSMLLSVPTSLVPFFPVLPFPQAVFSRNCEVTLDTFFVGIFGKEGLESRFVYQRRCGVNMDRIGQILVEIVIIF